MAAFVAVLFVVPRISQAQFKHDYLYKFQSRWSDIAVNNDSPTPSRVFIINESYSRIEEYDRNTATLSAIIGSYGTGSLQFNRPQGLVMDLSNNLYVLDTGNNRVVVYDANGGVGAPLTYVTRWGTAGTAARQFNNPSGIATDGTFVYIADTDNNRIQRCTTDGVTCTVWGALGNYDGKFSSPKGITYDDSQVPERVYVADTGNNRIQWFDTSGTYLGKFGTYGSSSGSSEESKFVLPYRVATESTNNFIFVMDTLNRIQRISKADLSTDYTITLSANGVGMKIFSSVLYVTSLPITYQTYTTSSLVLTGSMTNDIGHPVDLSLDSTGNIYINNNFTAPNYPVVQKFNSSFIQQGEWRGYGDFGSSVNGPLGFGMNSANDWFVADTDNNRVQKFSGTTNAWSYTITGAPTPFVEPKDAAPEPNTGNLYIADTGNSRIVKYDSSGNYLFDFGLPTPTTGGPTPWPGSTPGPYGITVDVNNKVYVADAGFNRIQRFDAAGNLEASWGTFGSADSSVIPQLAHPQGMGIGPEPTGYIYVADTGNNRIQRFDQNGTLSTRVLWGSYGPQDGYFINPRNVYVDSSSRVYVSEVGDVVGNVVRNRRIQVFGDATASAGLTITQTGGTTISEGLTASSSGYLIDNYTVKLNTQPSSVVNVSLTVSDPTQASVSSPTLVFTPENWNIPQVVTVYPIHDFVANGTRSIVISHKPSSSDIHYANPLALSWSNVTVTITDTIDHTGITFSSNTVPSTTEGTTLSNAYTIVLNTKPTANVVVTLTADSSMLVSPTSFTFTPTEGNWNSPRQVSILPLHDYVAQGTHVGTIFHSSASTDPNYGPGVEFSELSGNVLVTINDTDSAGVSVVGSPLSVSENGTTDTYSVNLTSKPSNDVMIVLSDASASAMITISPSTLTFTPTGWNPLIPQTVTVSAIADHLVNPINPRSTSILHAATSGDAQYQGITIPNAQVSVTDIDTSGLLIFKEGGGSVAVAEGGATDSYSMQLTSIPTGNVTVTLTSTDGQATTSAYIYTFTSSDWDTPQSVVVNAVDDALMEGAHNGIIKHTLTSTDSNFDNETAYQTAVITDNDAAGITLTLPNGVINIAEAGPSDVYFVRLNSQPSATVLLNVGTQNQATASPGVLTFNPGNWNNDQEITLTAIQDSIIEGSHTTRVTYTGISTDTRYNGLTANFVANISDDDSLSPGLSIIETDGGTSVTKDSVTDTYTLTLTSRPTANVKIKIVANGPDATTSAGVYWFTPTVWNVPQTVNVSAKTNPSGSKTVIFRHLITSLDAHYNDYTPIPTVNITVNENRSTSSSGPVAAPTCNKTPPNSAPHLFQINTTQTEATLYFTPLKDNISYYFIAYGFTPGDLRFGTSFEWGPYDGVIDHTVSMLTPGTKYYFMIRGGNGCATGPWSSSVAATAVGPERSAQTVYTYYGAAASSTPSSGSGSTSGGSPTGGIYLTRDLYPGSQGADVRSLQEYLNARGFTLASSGAGSPGNETTYYGNLTAAAVRRFQEAHFAEILSPLGYSSGTGICGSSTRSYINSHP